MSTLKGWTICQLDNANAEIERLNEDIKHLTSKFDAAQRDRDRLVSAINAEEKLACNLVAEIVKLRDVNSSLKAFISFLLDS